MTAGEGEGSIDRMVNTFKTWWRHNEGTEFGWKHPLVCGFCSDPKLAVYGCLCPCVLAGSISYEHGRHPANSCMCFQCCSPCNAFMFRLHDRKAAREKTGVTDQGLMTDFVSGGCSCFALVQEAKQLELGGGPAGLPAFNFKEPQQQSMKWRERLWSLGGGPRAHLTSVSWSPKRNPSLRLEFCSFQHQFRQSRKDTTRNKSSWH